MWQSFRAKLHIFVVLGLAAIVLTGWEVSSGATAALEAATRDRLAAIRQTRVRQVERYFQDLSAHALALAADESVLEALDAFRAAWPLLPAAAPAVENALRPEYTSAPAWFPADRRTLSLQHVFLAANPHPPHARDRLLEPPGPYGQAHARFHPTFHRYQTAFGFYDIFLIDAATQRVLYTVFKEIDLGVDLRTAPARDSALGKAVRDALALAEPDHTVLHDYEPYAPSHGRPAAFVAAPVWHAGAPTGVLVMQVSIDEVNRVMTNDGRWTEDGLGRTGQAYILGADGRLRSDLRPVIERHSSTTILAPLPARTAPVLHSEAPLKVPGLAWRLVAEIEEDEAFAPVRQLRWRMAAIGAAIAVVFFVLAALVSRSIARPVHALAESAARLGQRDFSRRVPVAANDEIGQLAASFNRMAANLERTTVSKAELEHLAGQLLTAQEDERRRIARELHDDVTQRVAAVAIEAGQRGLGGIKEQMARLADDIHRVSRSLHPALLDDLGLEAALEQECRSFFERGGPPVELSVAGDLTSLSPERQLVLYRITQEALRNVLKHAAAESVTLRVERNDDGVTLRLRDDGRGFRHDQRRGIGLTSMEERVRPYGGRVSIESTPGQGTEVNVWLP